MNKQISWGRILAEGVVIVASILLAFAIDAWWSGLEERRQERAALEVLARDLDGTVAQLDEYVRFMDDVTDASLSAYATLSEDEYLLYRDQLGSQLSRSLFRRTLRLPRAALADLVSTGGIRFIEDAGLRNSILRFHESAERTEEIVEKNSERFVDGLMGDVLLGSGLVLPRLPEVELNDLVAERNERVRTRLGGDFRHPLDPLWSLPPESREWDRLRSALLQVGLASEMSGVVARRLLHDARSLKDSLTAYLNGGAL